MIGPTNPQLPKYVVEVITSPKTRPIPPWEMEKEACQQHRGTSEHFKYPSLKNFLNM
jgi:hypothetical protein